MSPGNSNIRSGCPCATIHWYPTNRAASQFNETIYTNERGNSKETLLTDLLEKSHQKAGEHFAYNFSSPYYHQCSHIYVP